MDIRSEIESWFPNIVGKNFKIFETNGDFNCVSFSLDIYDKWIWTNTEFWPHNEIPRNSGINGFKRLYEKNGYVECANSSFESHYEKIAFYTKSKYPIHACKQFGPFWRSKLGPTPVIIEHELDWLCGDFEDAYGEVSFIMKRRSNLQLSNFQIR